MVTYSRANSTKCAIKHTDPKGCSARKKKRMRCGKFARVCKTNINKNNAKELKFNNVRNLMRVRTNIFAILK